MRNLYMCACMCVQVYMYMYMSSCCTICVCMRISVCRYICMCFSFSLFFLFSFFAQLIFIARSIAEFLLGFFAVYMYVCFSHFYLVCVVTRLCELWIKLFEYVCMCVGARLYMRSRNVHANMRTITSYAQHPLTRSMVGPDSPLSPCSTES